MVYWNILKSLLFLSLTQGTHIRTHKYIYLYICILVIPPDIPIYNRDVSMDTLYIFDPQSCTLLSYSIGTVIHDDCTVWVQFTKPSLGRGAKELEPIYDPHLETNSFTIVHSEVKRGQVVRWEYMYTILMLEIYYT